MNFEELDWGELDRLRTGFLQAQPGTAPYWRSAAALRSYDATYGERIGWKWDAVIDELQGRGWRPGATTLVDWGCGPGVATRRLVRWLGPAQVARVVLHDHSPAALDFATAALARDFPGLEVVRAAGDELRAHAAGALVVASHVLNELSPAAEQALRGVLAPAREIIWVESGSGAVSRRLGAIRDALRADFALIAPCTHALPCPMARPEQARDWCHFFAPPPPEIFASSDWVRFGQRAGVDLRSLPYAFFAAARTVGDDIRDPGRSRVIGRVEPFKPYVRLLNCDAAGLATLEIARRAAPALCRELSRTTRPLVYRWTRAGGRVTGGVAAAPPRAPEVP